MAAPCVPRASAHLLKTRGPNECKRGSLHVDTYRKEKSDYLAKRRACQGRLKRSIIRPYILNSLKQMTKAHHRRRLSVLAVDLTELT